MVAVLFATACKKHPIANLIVKNAVIWTGNDSMPQADAMAIVDDTIAAIGTWDEVKDWSNTNTEVLDAGGKFIVPGFIDAHVHFLTGGLGLASVQLRHAQTQQAFIDSIAKFVRTVKPGTWVLVGEWDHQNWGGQLPERSWIDSVTKDNPVLLNRLDGHMALANSAALKLAGVDAHTLNVAGGTIVRDAAGNPTGIFKDNAMDLVSKAIPFPEPEMLDRALQAAMQFVASKGVTTVHNMGDYGGAKDMEVFDRAAKNKTSITRAYVSMPLNQWPFLSQTIAKQGRGNKWVSIGVLKGYADGSLGSHTAAFFKPFSDSPKDSGFLISNQDSLRQWITQADAAGLQCAIHAIGDKAINTILNIFEYAIKQNGLRDRRFRIEHAQHIAPQDIVRFSQLGVVASMQPYHCIDDGRWAEKLIGSERIKTTYAFRSLIDTHATLAFGSDWFVAPPTPLEGIYAAVTRRTLDDKHPDGWVPEQKITVEEALKAYTKNAAFAGFQENDRGTLEKGKLADFVLLEKDLRKIDPATIKDIKVLRTVVGGKTVFDALKH